MKTRGELSSNLHHKLRELIISGMFAPGERLKEESLSRRFHVSRTPLRQALISLKGEGLIQSRPNAGFLVSPLSKGEVSSLYPIVWTLEALAVEESFDLLRSSLPELKQANNSFLKSRRNAEKAQAWDFAFHELLVSYSANGRLREIIANEKKKISRYERFYMRDNVQIEESVADHERIIRAIEKRERENAIEALKENWRHGMWWILGRIQAMSIVN